MRFTSLILVVIVCVVAALLIPRQTADVSEAHITSNPSGTGSLASTDQQPSTDSKARHSVIIRKPTGPPTVRLTSTDPLQRSAEVACSTCHSVRPPNHDNRTSATLDEFHQGLEFAHGQLACYACHNPSNAETLRLADGSDVEYAEVMTLCSQCHSKQAESFAHGAHGGMNGYWDLSRGMQTKNNCIDCHDPHSPKFPQMIVTFKPKDRFNSAEAVHAHQE
jgi:Doubled CXXCH motif (Paired_CXXCH_1)